MELNVSKELNTIDLNDVATLPTLLYSLIRVIFSIKKHS